MHLIINKITEIPSQPNIYSLDWWVAHKQADGDAPTLDDKLSCALFCILLLCAFQHAHANWSGLFVRTARRKRSGLFVHTAAKTKINMKKEAEEKNEGACV